MYVYNFSLASLQFWPLDMDFFSPTSVLGSLVSVGYTTCAFSGLLSSLDLLFRFSYCLKAVGCFHGAATFLLMQDGLLPYTWIIFVDIFVSLVCLLALNVFLGLLFSRSLKLALPEGSLLLLDLLLVCFFLTASAPPNRAAIFSQHFLQAPGWVLVYAQVFDSALLFWEMTTSVSPSPVCGFSCLSPSSGWTDSMLFQGC